MQIASESMVSMDSANQAWSMSHALREQLVSEFERAGVVQVAGLLTPAEAVEIGTRFTDRIEADTALGHDDHVSADDVLHRYPRIVHPHREDSADGARVRDLMLDERVQSVVTELIGPAWGAQSMFYFKPPGARGQALHQDNHFLRAHPETCLAVWIAIDDCAAENGSLRVVPGSHRQPLLCPEPADTEASFTNDQVPVPAGVPIRTTSMAAGDALVFHGSLVHGSLPNRTADRFRRALIFHFVPQASVQVASFYQPLLAPDGSAVRIGESAMGGPCGTGWVQSASVGKRGREPTRSVMDAAGELTERVTAPAPLPGDDLGGDGDGGLLGRTRPEVQSDR